MFARKKPAPVPQPVPAKTEHKSGYEALIFLSENGLSHTPNNYALAWQLKSDHRSLVAIAVDTILMEGRPLTQGDVDRIMTAEARRKKNPDGITDPDHDALRHQTLRLADLAAGAATQSSDFGRDLSGELFHLSGGSGSVEQIVKAMIHRTHGVEAQLTSAVKEIEDLRQQVEISKDDAQRDALTGLLNRRGALRELSARREDKDRCRRLVRYRPFQVGQRSVWSRRRRPRPQSVRCVAVGERGFGYGRSMGRRGVFDHPRWGRHDIGLRDPRSGPPRH